ncbi:hypothetical protein BT96DRAFT_742440, partial [Gymnopus androsaceus JB14]
IEKGSQLPNNSIASIEWAKKIENRTPTQKTAHVLVHLKTREAANQAIQQGMSIGGKWVTGHRDKRGPIRCMKCQQFNYIAKECTSEKDVCGRCDKNHRTKDCTATAEEFYCAVCKQPGHIAADRKCPTLLRKIRERARCNPESGYKFYVINHPDTWITDDD